MEQKITFGRSTVLLACLAAMGSVSAQTAPGPWTCGPEMYVVRSANTGSSSFFKYDMNAATWGMALAL